MLKMYLFRHYTAKNNLIVVGITHGSSQPAHLPVLDAATRSDRAPLQPHAKSERYMPKQSDEYIMVLPLMEMFYIANL